MLEAELIALTKLNQYQALISRRSMYVNPESILIVQQVPVPQS
jgi:hypothetical protein